MPHQKGNYMKLILSYIRRHIGMFATALFFLSLETLADLMQPTFMSYIVDDGVKGRDIGRILMYGAIMLGIAALGALGAVMQQYLCQPYFPADKPGDAQRYLPESTDAFL